MALVRKGIFIFVDGGQVLRELIWILGQRASSRRASMETLRNMADPIPCSYFDEIQIEPIEAALWGEGDDGGGVSCLWQGSTRFVCEVEFEGSFDEEFFNWNFALAAPTYWSERSGDDLEFPGERGDIR